MAQRQNGGSVSSFKSPSFKTAADAHTTRDHGRWPAAQTIAHHNWVWENLITPAGIAVVAADHIPFAATKR